MLRIFCFIYHFRPGSVKRSAIGFDHFSTSQPNDSKAKSCFHKEMNSAFALLTLLALS